MHSSIGSGRCGVVVRTSSKNWASKDVCGRGRGEVGMRGVVTHVMSRYPNTT